MEQNKISSRMFGATGREVTIVGLGGEGVLRTVGRTQQARTVIHEALNQGLTYFDSAPAYSDSELYYGTVWRDAPQKRAHIFQTSKSANRSRRGAIADLENTFKRIKTDYLDLWQIHDVRTEEELQEIAGTNGALEAFIHARDSGKVRFIGVTGHHDPNVLTRAVREWPVDAVLLPVNPAEGALDGFLTTTLPAAKEKRIAIIAMKVLGGGHYIDIDRNITPEVLIRYALSYDISLAIVGCSTPEEASMLVHTACSKEPLSKEESSQLVQIFTPYAKRLAFYRDVT